MKRTTAASRHVNKHGTGKDGFRDPGPAGVRGTLLEAGDADGYQEELAGAIEGLGFTLAGSNLKQLLHCLRQINAQTALNFRETDLESVGTGKRINAAAYGTTAVTTYVPTLAVGDDGIIVIATENGLNFSALVTPGSSYADDFLDVLWNNNLFVLVGKAGEIQTVEYTAGNHVATRRVTGLAFDWNAVAYGGGVYVVVGGGGNIRSSTNATAWTARTADASYAGDFLDVAYSTALGLFIAVGTDEEIQTSPDGSTWTRRHSTDPGADFGAVACNADHVVVSCHDSSEGDGIFRSVDGITWPAATVVTGAQLENVQPFARCFVANDVLQPYILYVSADGAVWRQRPVLELMPLGWSVSTRRAIFTDGLRLYAAASNGETWGSAVPANL